MEEEVDIDMVEEVEREEGEVVVVDIDMSISRKWLPVGLGKGEVGLEVGARFGRIEGDVEVLSRAFEGDFATTGGKLRG